MAEIVDAAARWEPKQCKLLPGKRIVAPVVNALMHRKPLYQVANFYEKQDVAFARAGCRQSSDQKTQTRDSMWLRPRCGCSRFAGACPTFRRN